MPAYRDGNLLARIGPPPDGNRLTLLQHHIVPNNSRQPNIPKRSADNQQNTEKPKHNQPAKTHSVVTHLVNSLLKQ
jgi:hypothetical protein